jgi:hypothetical protein
VDAERRLTQSAGPRLRLIPESYARLTGRPLLGDLAPTPEALWRADCVLLAHGTEPDPVFFYANARGLALFEYAAEVFLATPSRLSAEAPDRAERARLLDAVARDGFIDDYAGVRISASGRRFRIERATVWSLIDGDGRRHGQAAAFRDWRPL